MNTVDIQWGYCRVLSECPNYKVNELVINPKSKLAFEKHGYRNEHWYILKGQCSIITEFEKVQNVISKLSNESYLIGKNVWHQVINDSDEPCHILEVQYGDICEEEDIERR